MPIPCGLVLNELIYNSLKHGFPNGGIGHTRIGLRLEPAGKSVALTLSDDGVGYPQDLDMETAPSLGLQLVNMLAQQLKGRLECSNGPHAGATFVFPL